MPNDAHTVIGPSRREDLAKQVLKRLVRHDRLVGAVRQVAVATIDIAERSRLDDEQLHSRHQLAHENPPSSAARNQNLPVVEPVAPVVPAVMPVVPIRETPAEAPPAPVAP